MKKISALFLGLVISGAVFAQAAPLPASGEGAIGRTTDDCVLLNENIRINLSGGVSGALHCNPDRIAISACHVSGRQVSREVDIFTPTGCIEGAEGCVKTRGTRTGPTVPVASTLQGTVQPDYPGGDCTAEVALSVATSVGNE